MISSWQTMEFAMGQAIPLRNDYSVDPVRRLARQTKDVSRARRLLAIAAVLDDASRAQAARIGGMDRQTLRDWVIRSGTEEEGVSAKSSAALGFIVRRQLDYLALDCSKARSDSARNGHGIQPEQRKMQCNSPSFNPWLNNIAPPPAEV
jgi:transposase-like protein